MKTDNRILIYQGVHNRGWVLPFYLRNIYNIDYDKKLIDIYFYVNNCQPEDKSIEILKSFRKEHGDEYNSFVIEIKNNDLSFKDDRTVEVRNQKTYEILSAIRNNAMKKCVELKCDYWFNVDTDILVKPDIIKRLLNVGYPISASLIYNGYLFETDKVWKYPNVLNREDGTYKHFVNRLVRNPSQATENDIFEIDATGACCLISKTVCQNTKYQFHPLGEDLGWADSCREKGFKMAFSPSIYSQHIMSEEFLERFKNFGVEGY